MPARPDLTLASRWQRFGAASVRGFHAYAGWLVGITWKRFFVLSLLLLVGTAILQEVPPFSWTYTRSVSRPLPKVIINAPGHDAGEPPTHSGKPDPKNRQIEITINSSGVRIGSTRADRAASAASAASAADAGPSIEIRLPKDLDNPEVREAIEEAQRALEDAVRDAHDGVRDAAQAKHDIAEALRDALDSIGQTQGLREVSIGQFLPNLAMFWIIASMIVKITYKRQIQAEAQAARAVETAEAESLKRQVVEARMAAMQAQVEPHFLFNTLASIDHLIEVDPQRASQMQKHLIALLRASMPTLREANDGGGRDLGRELAMVRPYLEILKVRMEERLATSINVPDGLLSAEFPPMMLQTLVENAIKHGLEPKPEGGRLDLDAEIVHGKLAVKVADTGLGFGRATTAGTGVGLANVRERLGLLYGGKASLTIAENPGGGTVATIALPYRPVEPATA